MVSAVWVLDAGSCVQKRLFPGHLLGVRQVTIDHRKHLSGKGLEVRIFCIALRFLQQFARLAMVAEQDGQGLSLGHSDLLE
jgi:hypothetical protein